MKSIVEEIGEAGEKCSRMSQRKFAVCEHEHRLRYGISMFCKVVLKLYHWLTEWRLTTFFILMTFPGVIPALLLVYLCLIFGAWVLPITLISILSVWSLFMTQRAKAYMNTFKPYTIRPLDIVFNEYKKLVEH